MNYVNKLKDILKNEGLRYTKQRQQVWDEIRGSSEHRDAEEIYLENKASKSKHGEKVSRATVYRTIDVLVKNNLVRKMELEMDVHFMSIKLKKNIMITSFALKREKL